MDPLAPPRSPSLSVTRTVSRQTPDDSFGKALARTAQEVGRVSAGLVGGILGPGLGMSAAAAGVASVASAATRLAGAGSSDSAPGLPEKGDSWDLLQAQTLMNQESQQFSMAYLKLQDEMQRESREQNTLSNIMKVRHDSAKAAINNIR